MKRKSSRLWRTLAVLALAAALALALVLGLRARQTALAESRAAVRDAVLRCASQCYAVEGVYPPSLGYLEAHYGLVVNHRRYIVTYDAYSSNLPPEVQVLVRGEEGAA